MTSAEQQQIGLTKLWARVAIGDRYSATESEVSDGDRAMLVLCAYSQRVSTFSADFKWRRSIQGLHIDAIMRGEDPAQRFACGEMLEEDLL